MLVAEAQVVDATLVTIDHMMRPYHVPLLLRGSEFEPTSGVVPSDVNRRKVTADLDGEASVLVDVPAVLPDAQFADDIAPVKVS